MRLVQRHEVKNYLSLLAKERRHGREDLEKDKTVWERNRDQRRRPKKMI
jgi:hypothetical protein